MENHPIKALFLEKETWHLEDQLPGLVNGFSAMKFGHDWKGKVLLLRGLIEHGY